MLLGAANRDPRQWPEPDRYNIDRATTGHVAFGAGVHMCVGQLLARLEGETLLALSGARVRAHRTGPRADPAFEQHAARLGVASSEGDACVSFEAVAVSGASVRMRRRAEATPFDPSDFLDTKELQIELLAEAARTGDSSYIAHALGTITPARGMAKVAQEARLTRQALYRSLGKTGFRALRRFSTSPS